MYFDDCIIGAYDFPDLTTKLELFISEIEKLGLRISPKKYRVGMREFVWLGHRISEKGIRPDMDRVSVRENWKTPSCLSESRASMDWRATFVSLYEILPLKWQKLGIPSNLK